ncbi:metallophosphoesterase [Brucella ciceri]|uniref:metallophosphoesterase n=1 Tax=Brucella ciceri TaxID=391287 RepID=UPI000DE27CF3|nr:metallophosphoesterase [Brucella ciceri]MCH6206374.1 metallophosphoesterase [Brucella ciceri]
MRLWIISDLHLLKTDPEQFGSRLRIPKADVCVLAGDICDDLEAGLSWVGSVIAPHMPVIFVPGNHDFFGRALTTTVLEAESIAAHVSGKANGRHQIHVLDNKTIVIGGTRFIGTTLWTDFAIHAPPNADAPTVKKFREAALANMRLAMPEYREVYFNEVIGNVIPRLMTAYDAYNLHIDSRKYLVEELSKPFVGPTVVATHHAPHPKSISTFHGRDSLTPAFVSDLTDIIEQFEPDLWVHGHVHENFDYYVGKTRIYCHPYGNGNPNFSWKGGLIDIPSTPVAALRM